MEKEGKEIQKRLKLESCKFEVLMEFLVRGQIMGFDTRLRVEP